MQHARNKVCENTKHNVLTAMNFEISIFLFLICPIHQHEIKEDAVDEKKEEEEEEEALN